MLAAEDGQRRNLWRACRGQQELEVFPYNGSEPAAWLVGQHEVMDSHPLGTVWATKLGGELELVALEGLRPQIRR